MYTIDGTEIWRIRTSECFARRGETRIKPQEIGPESTTTTRMRKEEKNMKFGVPPELCGFGCAFHHAAPGLNEPSTPSTLLSIYI